MGDLDETEVVAPVPPVAALKCSKGREAWRIAAVFVGVAGHPWLVVFEDFV